MCRKIYREIIILHTAQGHEEASQTLKMEPFAKIVNFCKKLYLRGGVCGREFQPSLKFQLVKPWLGFILHIKQQQCKNRLAIIWKSFITVNSWNFTKVWTTRDEIFISCKRVMIDCTHGFKLEKQSDVSVKQC